MPSPDSTLVDKSLLLRQKRRRWLIRLTWCYVVLLLAYWFALRWWGDIWWPGTLLLYGPRWPIALPLVLLVPFAFKWARITLIPCCIALLLLVFPITGFNIPFGALLNNSTAESVRLRVVSFNANMGKINMSAWNTFLLQTDPDIVVCQEWPLGSARPPIWNKDWHVQEHIGNLLVASRWPIPKTELLREDALRIRGYAAWYELDTPLGALSLADVHLPTPRGEGELEEVLHGKWNKLNDLDKLSGRRLQASHDVRNWLAKYRQPMLVVGDLNLPMDSNIYGDVWNRYDDAFGKAGWGWGNTKWTHWYGMRIDHILFEKIWTCSRCWVGENMGSDHLPLIADLFFTGGN